MTSPGEYAHTRAVHTEPDPTDTEVDAAVAADDEAAEAALRDEVAAVIADDGWCCDPYGHEGGPPLHGECSECDRLRLSTADLLLPVVARHIADAEARGFERGKRDPWSGWLDGKKAGAVEERERIAAALEERQAVSEATRDAMQLDATRTAFDQQAWAYGDAARIARGGGE